ncbi:hypothetical protein QUA43_00575 [Microcoleus sp. N9_B4]
MIYQVDVDGTAILMLIFPPKVDRPRPPDTTSKRAIARPRSANLKIS